MQTIKEIYFSETNENTLATFLFWMNKIPRSEIQASKNILSLYLTDDMITKDLGEDLESNRKLREYFYK